MKKIISLMLAMLVLAMPAFAAYDSPDAAQAQIDAYMSSLPMDETDGSGQRQIYPEAFAGMYVDGDNQIVVCLTEDTPENRQEYIDFFGSEDGLGFKTVDLPYSTLMQYYITIGARHVSTSQVVINLYKTKRYEINPEENRVDIWMYAEPDTLEEILEYFGTLGFGDGIFIYFVDENNTEVISNQDEVMAEKAEREASATPTPEPTPDPTLDEQLEESGINIKSIGIPVLVVAVIIGLFFVISKLRSRNVDLDKDLDDFSDEFKK